MNQINHKNMFNPYMMQMMRPPMFQGRMNMRMPGMPMQNMNMNNQMMRPPRMGMMPIDPRLMGIRNPMPMQNQRPMNPQPIVPNMTRPKLP